MENLKRRRVVEDAKCKACLAAEEDTLHAIWSCEKLQHIWFPCFSWVQTEHPQIPEVQELISLVGQRSDKLELFAVVAWFIWNHRNRLRLNEKGLASDRILQAAMTYLTEFQAKLPKAAPKPSKGHVRWCPPMGERFKTNYDGAVFSESGEAGIGVVVRNAKGEVIAALAEKILYPGSVEMLEALAARRAVNFIVELGFAGSEFEGDSEVVCRALRSTESGHSSIGQIVKDIMSIIGSLSFFSFSHIRRQGNCVAHALARRAIVSFPLLVWMEHVPSDIEPFVIADIPGSQ
ncbi:uncharacterized protein LOC115970418 [Quercus lobata]|uniref:uncharacterized protein LOC115970418 n=1 Tax=Quercus lobata TaxID=97700 RepID=UPI001245D46F|nr:uncharacterized protein LOC115970418 [Quercus lobata]